MNKLQYSFNLLTSLNSFASEDPFLKKFLYNINLILLGDRTKDSNIQIISSNLELVLKTFHQAQTIEELMEKLLKEKRDDFNPTLKILFASIDSSLSDDTKGKIKRIVMNGNIEEMEFNKIVIQGYIGVHQRIVFLFDLPLAGCIERSKRVNEITEILDRHNDSIWIAQVIYDMLRREPEFRNPDRNPGYRTLQERLNDLGLNG